MTSPGRAALLLVLTACGGHVGQTQRQTDAAAAGAGGGVDAATAGAGGALSGVSAVDGGAETAVVSGGAAAEVAGAAAAGDSAIPSVPPIGSGTRYCENERYCFGLSCYAPAELEQHVCVNSCQSDDDCGAREVCLESAGLDAGCYRVCQTPFDCEYGFDCFDVANVRQMLVCFPTPWARAWVRLHP